MSLGRIGRWRMYFAWFQAAVLLGLPFLAIAGQSALRFDVPGLNLYFFGATIPMDRFFIVLSAVLFAAFVFIALTMLFGRLWCGWACPQTVLSDITSFLERSRGMGRVLSYIAVFILSALVGADMLWYFVSPYDFPAMLASNNVVRVSWLVLTLILFIDLVFVRRVFCATVCPYAKMQSVLFDDRTLLIAYDPRFDEECMGCRACRRVCPVGIDIRDGLDMACISCAKCVDACSRMRAVNDKDTLVDYHWGGPERGGGRPSLFTRPLRINALISLMVALGFGLLFTFTLVGRTDFSATLRADPSIAPRLAGSGELALNAYIITLVNHTGRQTEFELTSADALLVVRGVLSLPPRGRGDIKVYATIEVSEEKRLPDNITIELSQKGGDMKKLNIAFRPPGGLGQGGQGI